MLTQQLIQIRQICDRPFELALRMIQILRQGQISLGVQALPVGLRQPDMNVLARDGPVPPPAGSRVARRATRAHCTCACGCVRQIAPTSKVPCHRTRRRSRAPPASACTSPASRSAAALPLRSARMSACPDRAGSSSRQIRQRRAALARPRSRAHPDASARTSGPTAATLSALLASIDCRSASSARRHGSCRGYRRFQVHAATDATRPAWNPDCRCASRAA